LDEFVKKYADREHTPERNPRYTLRVTVRVKKPTLAVEMEAPG
jgi:hypothetical protein